MPKTKYVYSSTYWSTHQIILRELGENNCILYLGCSGGYLGKNSPQNKFYGIDADKIALLNAKKYYADVQFCDLNNTNKLKQIINKKFDVIILADILEHLLFSEEFLRLVSKHLNSRGKIIVSLPNVAHFTIRLKLLFGNFTYTDTGILDRTHLHLYTERTAKELFDKSNLSIMKSYGGSNHFGFIINKLNLFKKSLSFNLIYVLEKEC
ncbi:MAG: methyltransferase domain-containing protein [Candidatus Nanoarchaeia archaeon]|nr:methyltransferase domain-containing protein [Candidatus Nanoarchaeia archaeon]